MAHYDMVPRLPYLNPQEVVQHLDQALGRYKFLRCKVDLYTSETGQQTNLLHLEGTVPMFYQGSNYNIPVCVWLLASFPNEAPVCFVVPTETMIVKNGPVVDSSGRIYLASLVNWMPRMSRLVQILDDMSNAFSQYPPLLSKPAGYQPPVARPPVQPPPVPAPQWGAQPPQWTPPLPQSAFPASAAGQGMYPQAQPGRPQMPPPRPTVSAAAEDAEKLERLKANFYSDVKGNLNNLKKEKERAAEENLRTTATLQSRSVEIQNLLRQMEADLNELNGAITWYTERNLAMARTLDSPVVTSNLDVDASISPNTPLYAQIANLMTEEKALDDVLYELSNALTTKRIDLATYLRHVRTISRSQFLARALCKKCLSVAYQTPG